MEARKRGRSDGFLNGNNGGFKKNKQETENFSTGIGSKSKPCTRSPVTRSKAEVTKEHVTRSPVTRSKANAITLTSLRRTKPAPETSDIYDKEPGAKRGWWIDAGRKDGSLK